MELNKSIDLQTINQDWDWWYNIPDFYLKKKTKQPALAKCLKANYSKLQVNNPLSTSITRQLAALLSFVLYIWPVFLPLHDFIKNPEHTVYIWLRYVNFSWHCSAGGQTVVWCKWLGRQGYWFAASYFALRSWLNQVNAWNC